LAAFALSALVGVVHVGPPRFGRKGSRFAPLFSGHASGPGCPATRPATPAEFGHDAGNLGWSRAVMFHWWIGEHSDLVMGKLVKIWFGMVAWMFRRHTLLVSHGCVSGSSVPKFKVAHYRKLR
jgi:hypothetical protein